MLVNFLTKNPNPKTIFFFGGGSGVGWGAGWGGGVGEGIDGWTDEQAKPICPFNFFEVRGITNHLCISYVPDKLNL